MTSVKPPLGYVGTGLMGGPMVERLLSLGYPVRVFDIDANRLMAVERAGAHAVRSPVETAAGVHFVLLNLPSLQAVETAVFGTDGLVNALSPSQMLVDFSTIPASACRDLAGRLRERCGCSWIDAPVSGGPSASGAGTLTIMAGGGDDDIARIMPLMSDISRNFTHVGPTGAGSVAKTIAQLVVGSTYAVLAEAVRLAEASGIDPAILPSCVRGGHADGELMRQIYPRIAAHDFAPRAYARQLLKDLEAVQDLARETHAPTPMSGQATQLYRLLIAAGHAETDACGVYKLFEMQTAAAPATSGGHS
jgi:3-hydroxyisobutyrate dehydrogenase-like beta-hydroxyacid dehydrogenase